MKKGSIIIGAPITHEGRDDMDDQTIIALFFQRDESALKETAQKYAAYCRNIALHLLSDQQDADEVLNDTWLAAWNSIPPHKPEYLPGFLGKLTRNISLKRIRADRTQKRSTPEYRLVYEEIADWLQSPENVEQQITQQELTASINLFLGKLSDTERNVFVRRYYYMQPVAEIAAAHGFSSSKVKSMLLRIRKKLYTYLKKEDLL